MIEEVRFAGDSPLEGDGFEVSVPREMGSDVEASSELGRIDCWRGGYHPSSRRTPVNRYSCRGQIEKPPLIAE
jgi:hypothetical protein